MGRKSNQYLEEKVNQEQINLFLDSVCAENSKLCRHSIEILIKTGLITKLKIQQYNVCSHYWLRMKTKQKGLKKWDIVKETATRFDLTDEAVGYIVTRFNRIVFAF